MRINYPEYFDWLSVDLTSYLIKFYIQDVTENEFKTFARKVQYYCEKDGVSWLSVLSSTDSKTARIIFEKTGKPGRPAKKIKGKKVPAHIHTTVTGTQEKSARQAAMNIKSAIDKRYKKLGFNVKVSSIRSVSGADGYLADEIHYQLKQADMFRSGGSFDLVDYHDTHNYGLD